MKDKIFEANVVNKKYNIVIEVYENCAGVKVEKLHNGESNMTYHELIGILETQKQRVIWEQLEANLKKKLKPKSKK